MLLPRRLADDRPQFPQPGGIHRPGQHIANPLRQVVRLVDGDVTSRVASKIRRMCTAGSSA